MQIPAFRKATFYATYAQLLDGPAMCAPQISLNPFLFESEAEARNFAIEHKTTAELFDIGATGVAKGEFFIFADGVVTQTLDNYLKKKDCVTHVLHDGLPPDVRHQLLEAYEAKTARAREIVFDIISDPDERDEVVAKEKITAALREADIWQECWKPREPRTPTETELLAAIPNLQRMHDTIRSAGIGGPIPAKTITIEDARRDFAFWDEQREEQRRATTVQLLFWNEQTARGEYEVGVVGCRYASLGYNDELVLVVKV